MTEDTWHIYVYMECWLWFFPPFFFQQCYSQQSNVFHTKLCSLSKKISVISYFFLATKVYLVMILKMQEKFKSNFVAIEKTTALDFSSHLIAFYNNKPKFAIQKLPKYRALINNPVRSHIQSDYYFLKNEHIKFQEKGLEVNSS